MNVDAAMRTELHDLDDPCRTFSGIGSGLCVMMSTNSSPPGGRRIDVADTS